MVNQLIDANAGADALLINQLYDIASGGDFWQSGGQISPGSSGTEIQLSVGSVTVNIGGSPVTHGSQPVTHSVTSGAYRTDVVFADASGVGVTEGVELAKVPAGNQFPALYQPGPNPGALVPGVPLWCVHITPDDTVSNDIESWQWQNRRMNAETLDPAAVAALLAEFDTTANGAIDTLVADSKRFAGRTPPEHKRNTFTLSHSMEAGVNHSEYIHVPVANKLVVWRAGATQAGGGSPNGIHIQVSDESNAVLRDFNQESETDVSTLATFARPDETLQFKFVNETTTDAGGVIMASFEVA